MLKNEYNTTLATKILFFSEEKENKSTKFVKGLEKYYRKMFSVVLLIAKTRKNALEMKVY